MRTKNIIAYLLTVYLVVMAGDVQADPDDPVPALCPPQIALDLAPGSTILQADFCFTLSLPEPIIDYTTSEDNYQACNNYLNCFAAADTIYVDCIDSGNGAGCQPLADMNLMQCEMHLELCLA